MSGTLVVQNLQGPASGANANKIIVPAGQVLDASAGFVAPAGHVIQVVNATTIASPFASTSSSVLVSSGFSVSITPTKIGSRIRVQFQTSMQTTSGYGGGVSIYNGATNLHASSNYGIGSFCFLNVGTDNYYNAYTEVMYTTTSLLEQTFTLWFRVWSSSLIRLNTHAGMATAVATEIAG